MSDDRSSDLISDYKKPAPLPSPLPLQPILKCAQKYAGHTTIGCFHEQDSVSELKN